MEFTHLISVGVAGWFIFLIFFFQAYHSQIKEFSQQVGNMAILPLRTQYRGPATTGNFDQDIIDEAIYYFKANIFFREYEVNVSSSSINQRNFL